MGEEYEKGFIDALETVLDISNREKENLVQKIGELWIRARERRSERIQEKLGLI
jgi:hypothetical protein